MRACRATFRLVCLVAGLPATAAAQCAPGWLVPTGFGVGGTVLASTTWDPDGPGPLPARLVVGGTFGSAGGLPAHNLASFEPLSGTWSTLGGGTNGEVRALTVLGNDLVAGGQFTTAGGTAVGGLARWNGSAWQPLGGPLVGAGKRVNALAVLPNGDLVAGGDFLVAHGAAANCIARWNGVAWSAMGNGFSGPPTVTTPTGVYSLVVQANGRVVAGGQFNASGSTTLPALGEWNGTAWAPLGNLLYVTGQTVRSLAATSIGLVAVVPASGVHRWNGQAWQLLPNPPLTPAAVRELPNGDLLVAGSLTFGALQGSVAQWTGSAWLPRGSFWLGDQPAVIGAMPGGTAGEFVVGGTLTQVGGAAAQGLVWWNGSSWTSSGVPAGFGPQPQAVAVDASGQLLVAGPFSFAFGTAFNGLAQWDGSVWQPPAGPGFTIGDAILLADGTLVVCGQQQGVWQRLGTTWSPLPTGLGAPTAPLQLTAGPHGQFAVATATSLRAWQGGAWQTIPVTTGPRAITYAADGSLLAGGDAFLPQLAGRVGRWNGSAWTSLDPAGTLGGTVTCLVEMPNGDVVAGGSFSFGNRIARRTAAGWSAIGAGFDSGVLALAALPDGTLFAGGSFTLSGTTLCPWLAHWDGQAWQALPGGVNGPVLELAFHPAGELIAIGNFSSPTPYVARLQSPCRAAVAPAGGGCPSSGGGNRLVATAWPLLGARFASRGRELPPSALVVVVSSPIAWHAALDDVLPAGQAGCTLWVQPDVVTLASTAGGIATWQTQVPQAAALLGASFRHQMVPCELGPSGTLLAVTSTNALELTIGAF